MLRRGELHSCRKPVAGQRFLNGAEALGACGHGTQKNRGVANRPRGSYFFKELDTITWQSPGGSGSLGSSEVRNQILVGHRSVC